MPLAQQTNRLPKSKWGIDGSSKSQLERWPIAQQGPKKVASKFDLEIGGEYTKGDRFLAGSR